MKTSNLINTFLKAGASVKILKSENGYMRTCYVATGPVYYTKWQDDKGDAVDVRVHHTSYLKDAYTKFLTNKIEVAVDWTSRTS